MLDEMLDLKCWIRGLDETLDLRFGSEGWMKCWIWHLTLDLRLDEMLDLKMLDLRFDEMLDLKMLYLRFG
jgi:hypothetical protein